MEWKVFTPKRACQLSHIINSGVTKLITVHGKRNLIFSHILKNNYISQGGKYNFIYDDNSGTAVPQDQVFWEGTCIS